MDTIYSLLKRAKELKNKSQVDSITPEEVGKLHEDTLAYIASLEQSADGLGIKKVYQSKSTMEADTDPVGTNGKTLRYGQLVSIYDDAHADSSENGNIYAYQKPGWLLMGKVGDKVTLPIVQEVGNSEDSVMSQKAVTDAIKKESDSSYINTPLQEIGKYKKIHLSTGLPANAISADFTTLAFDLSGFTGKLNIERIGKANEYDVYSLIKDRKAKMFERISKENTEIDISDVDYLFVAGYKKTYNVTSFEKTIDKTIRSLAKNFENIVDYQEHKVNHLLKDIVKHSARDGWGNDFKVSEVKGLELYCHNIDVVVLSSRNIKTNSTKEIGRYVVVEGVNVIVFEKKLTLSKDERLFVFSICGGLKATDTGGVGMYEGELLHQGWEIAYNIISDEKRITNKQIYNDVESLKKNISNLTGKVIAKGKWQSLGTSITWYNNNVSSKFTAGYQTRVQEYIAFDSFINGGVNGGVLNTAIQQVQRADYYTIEHGVNDWGRSTPVGTIDDYISNSNNGTFAAIYRKLIDTIYMRNGDAKIILCTPRRAYGFSGFLPDDSLAEKNGIRLSDYADLIKQIAARESFPVCDWFYESGCNQRNLTDLSIDVALHPNDRGYQQMSKLLVDTFLKII